MIIVSRTERETPKTEAEVATRFGHTRRALALLHHAEEMHIPDEDQPAPV